MRSAENILDEWYQPGMHWKHVNKSKVIEAMKVYGKYLIEECAEIVGSFPGNGVIDKKQILNLINDIK